MSADNGVYILRTPAPDRDGFEFRVAHAQAIENAEWPVQAEADEYIVATFGDSWVFSRRGRAKAVAHLIHDEIVASGWYTEYGVQVIDVDRPFPRQRARLR